MRTTAMPPSRGSRTRFCRPRPSMPMKRNSAGLRGSGSVHWKRRHSAGRPPAPGVWPPVGYLWHVVDVLRFGAERLWMLRGFENMLTDPYTDEAEFCLLRDAIVEHNLAIIDQFAKRGVRGVGLFAAGRVWRQQAFEDHVVLTIAE